MLDNITALNIDEELINNKTVKAGVGKHSKPAKLSSGKTFRAKTMEIMNKIKTPVSAPEVAPAASEQPVAAAPEVAAQAIAPAAPTEATPAPDVQPAPAELPTIELPTSEKIIEKANTVGISVVDLPAEGTKTATAPRKLKVSKTVVARTGNALKVLANVPKEEAKQEEVTPEAAPSEEVQVAPEVNVVTPPAEVATQEETETPDVNEQPNFFLGQKLNTEEVTEEEPKMDTSSETEVEPEATEESKGELETTSEVTQEEKENKLNQYLNGNQEAPEEEAEDLNLSDVLKDLDEYKTASEQIYSGQNEINKLNKDLAEARRILAEKKKEAQQMIVNAKEILESQRNEITSKTQELSDVREAIIRWTELKEKNQNRVNQDEDNSYGKVA